jgi:addiction module RelE/StbE family toxin
MVRKIVWSRKSQEDKKDIFLYWNERNKSKLYSKKLNKLFISAVEFVAEFPLVGKKSNIKNVRMKVVRDYLIIYEFNDECIFVLRVWSTQQNPERIKDIVG